MHLNRCIVNHTKITNKSKIVCLFLISVNYFEEIYNKNSAKVGKKLIYLYTLLALVQ